MRGASFFVLRSKKPRELCGREREFQEAFCTGAGCLELLKGQRPAQAALCQRAGVKKGAGALRRGGGPHRPGGAVCPAAEGGALRKKGVQKKKLREGEGVPQQKKRPRRRERAAGARGRCGAGSGEAGGREKGRRGEAPALSPAGALAGEGRAGLWRQHWGNAARGAVRQMMPGR